MKTSLTILLIWLVALSAFSQSPGFDPLAREKEEAIRQRESELKVTAYPQITIAPDQISQVRRMNLQKQKSSADKSDESSWLQWDNGEFLSALGSTNSFEFSVATRFEPSDLIGLDGLAITKIRFYPADVADYTLKIWQGSGLEPAEIFSQPLSDNVILNQLNEVILNEPVEIDAEEVIWIGYTVVTSGNSFPAGVDTGPAVVGKGDMFKFPGDLWGSLYELTHLNYNWIVGAYAESLAEDGAPAAALSFAAQAGENGSLSSQLLWTNPSLTFNGEPLTDLVSVQLFRGQDLIYTITDPVIGQAESFSDSNVSDDGLYTYTLFASNNVGDGPSVKRSVFIGEDVPAAPLNVLLESQDNDGFISWDAPQAGFNGGYIDPDGIIYTIKRMPDGIIVAESITQTEFLDDAVPGIGNYFYIVTASNLQGEGGSASSNTALLSAGTALIFETFDYPQGTLPPGWTIAGVNHHWSISSTSNAGGDSPEMRLSWNPLAIGTSRLVSPSINANGQNGLRLLVKMYLDDFSSSENEKIAVDFTTDSGQNWQTIWEQQLQSEDLPQGEYEFVFAIPENTTNLQIAFRFQGNSFNIDYWYIDDLSLQPLTDNDLAAISLTGSVTPGVGSEAFYTLKVHNMGVNPQTDYTVKLMGEGDVELSSLPGLPISTGEIISYQLPWTPFETGQTFIYGSVELENDELPANNTTPHFSVQVQPEGTYIVQIGNMNTFPTENIPFDFFWSNSYSQTLYYPEEIGIAAGVITAVKYDNSFVNVMPEKPVRIWIGETSAEDLTGGWVDFESLTLVFEGDVLFPQGENEIMIALDNPYVYNGGNLVIYTNRMWDAIWYSQWNKFFGSLDQDRNRTRRTVSDNNLDEMPGNPGSGFTSKWYPNTTLFFSLTGLGSLEGFVTDGSDPLEGVSVTIEGTNTAALTDEDGFYRFPFLIPGTYTVNFDLFGYYLESEEQVTVSEDETTMLDVELEAIPRFTLMGAVEGNDGLIPEDIQVTLAGYANYNTTGSTAGAFVFDNVYEGVYKLTVSAPGYEDYIDDSLLIEEDNDLGTIILAEIILPPGGLIVDYDNYGPGNALLTWELGSQAEFRYDNGTVDAFLGLYGDNTSVLGSAYPYNAEISEVSWLLSDYESADLSTLKLWIYGLLPDGSPDPDDLLYTADGVPTLVNEWTTYELAAAVTAPYGFFVGLGVDGFLALGADDGSDPDWPFIPGTQFYNIGVSFYYPFIPIETAGLEVNFLLRATGKNFGPVELTKQNFNQADDDAGSVQLVYQMLEEPLFAGQTLSSARVKNNKALTGFNVFLDDMDNPVAFVEEQEFLFTELPEGNLTAGVQSVYTSGVSDIVTISFELLYPVEVTVNLTTNSGDSAEGAMVSLVNEQESQYVYTSEADETGTVIFPSVRKGLYTLSVALPGFDEIVLQNTDIQENGTLEFVLIELLEDPFNLMVLTEGLPTGQALFSWNNPIEGWTEGFEGGELPAGWSQIITNQSFTSGMPATWQITGPLNYSNPVIPSEGDYQAYMIWNWFEQDEWLISPEFLAPMGDLVFWYHGTNGSQFGDNYYVKISDDGGDSWTILWNASDLPPGNNYYQTPVVIDLSPWSGQDVLLAWHADDGPNDIGMWYSWGIDDITVGGEPMELKNFTVSQGNTSLKTGNKALLGFNIYLDGALVGENVVDNQFLFAELPLGDYEAGVQAVYTTGMSEIITTAFEIHQSWALVLEADPAEGGTLLGGGFYPEGELVDLIAVASPGYSFLHWAEPNGTIISEEPQIQVTTTNEDKTLIAAFEQDEAFTLTFILDMSAAQLFDPSSELVGVTGSMHNWQVLGAGAKIQTLNVYDEGNMWYTVSFLLAPGAYSYRYFLNEGVHNHEWEEDMGREIILDKDVTVFDVWGMPTSIHEIVGGADVRLFPNPFTEYFFIESNSAVKRMVIYNTMGMVIRDMPLNGDRINVSELPEGVYIIHLYDDTKRITVRKMLKR